jgi:hypothetical protein
MSSIRDFLRNLLPTFGRDRIIEDCRLTRAEIEETLKPMYGQAAVFLKNWSFKSDEMQDRIETWKGLVKSNGGNIIVTIDRGLPLMVQNLNDVEELIKASIGDEVVTAGLTYKKAQLIQFVTNVQFVSRFLVQFLNYVYVCETAKVENSGITSVRDALAPAEKAFIEDNFISFCTAFEVVTESPGEVKKKLAEVPDIVVTDDNIDTLPQTMGAAKLDPLKQNLIIGTGTWSLWYGVGLLWAEWQAARYKQAKETLKMVQLRKLNLEQVSQGKPNPKVQKEIEYLEQRAKDLQYKITKMEGK